MSKRLDQEREKKLSPTRMDTAINAIVGDRGYRLEDRDSNISISFMHKGSLVTYWPYSGWASGKSIKDGRGLNNLLKQLDE